MSEWTRKPSPAVRTVVGRPVSGEALAVLIRAVVDRGVPCRFRARGLSMSPFIKDGDIVTVSPPTASGPGRGEIAAFVHPETGKARVHRILGRGDGLYLFKGDGAQGPDGEVGADRVLGVVTKVERDGRVVWTGSGWAGAAIGRSLRSGRLIRVARRIGRAFRRRGRES